MKLHTRRLNQCKTPVQIAKAEKYDKYIQEGLDSKRVGKVDKARHGPYLIKKIQLKFSYPNF